MTYEISINRRGQKIVRFKYGKIYDLLIENGFCFGNTVKKGVYFRKTHDESVITNLFEMRLFLLDWIETKKGIEPNMNLVLEECLRVNPINRQRPNKLLLVNNNYTTELEDLFD